MKKIILLAAFVVAFATQAQGNTTYKQETIEFIKITNSGLRESNSHGIHTL